MPAPARRLTAAQIGDFYAALQADNPHPDTELVYKNPYTLLVAVILSAQATDKSVNLATKPLFAKITKPEAMLALGEEKLRTAIKSIGLYRTKAKNIIAMSQILCQQHQSQVPADRAGLEALPGCGRKSANVILNTIFGEEVIAVDTHVFRVANRTGLAAGETPAAVEKALARRTPKIYRRHAHHWLVLLGRYICKARQPECGRCPAEKQCGYKSKNL